MPTGSLQEAGAAAGADPIHEAAPGSLTLLEGLARVDPGRAFVIDQAGRTAWCGREPMTLSRFQLLGAVRRLAGTLRGLRLPAGTSVGICLPNGSELCVSVLAVELAGLTACLLPLTMQGDELGRALELARVRLVITQSRAGDLALASLFCALAARWFPLRFVAAFGPEVPDGVIDLDRSTAAAIPAGEAQAGWITFEADPQGMLAVHRTTASLMAATGVLLARWRIRDGDRVVTAVAQDDLMALATGLFACLFSGATLECHGFFDKRDQEAALERSGRLHVVAPSRTERSLRDLSGFERVQTLVLLHRPPFERPAQQFRSPPVVDVVSLGERAVLPFARLARQRSHTLAAELRESGNVAGLMRARVDENGWIELGGAAAQMSFFGSRPEPASPSLLGLVRQPFRIIGDAGSGRIVQA